MVSSELSTDSALISTETANYSAHDGQQFVSICWKCAGTGFKPTKTRLRLQLPCTVCPGSGRIKPKEAINRRPYRPFKAEWNVPGPSAAYDMYHEDFVPEENEMISSLCGHWMLYQLENGHRMTTDDLMGAAVAIRHMRAIKRIPSSYLDIGTGLGSVLLFVNWAFFGEISRCSAIEAQSIHVKLARKSCRINGVDQLCNIIHHDIRSLIETEIAEFPRSQKFDLITGTPPYFPPPNGALPTNAGRGMCAFEFRGGIEMYCKLASLHLAKNKGARFIVVQTSLEVARTTLAGQIVGFQLIERWDVHGMTGKLSLFSIFVFQWHKNDAPCSISGLDVRGRDGQFTHSMKEIYELTGKPPAKYEPRSVPRSWTPTTSK